VKNYEYISVVFSSEQSTIVRTINHCQNNQPSSEQSTIVRTINHRQNNQPSSEQSTIVRTINHRQNNQPSSEQSTIVRIINHCQNNQPSSEQSTESSPTPTDGTLINLQPPYNAWKRFSKSNTQRICFSSDLHETQWIACVAGCESLE